MCQELSDIVPEQVIKNGCILCPILMLERTPMIVHNVTRRLLLDNFCLQILPGVGVIP